MTDENKEIEGVIGVVPIHGRPVIYAIAPEPPSVEVRRKLRHLVVVSWRYDGDSNNGMPDAPTNEGMCTLEGVISPLFSDKGDSIHAYHRTGDNLKEFTYYVADTKVFMDRLNEALQCFPRFPIEVTFVHDEDWSDFMDIASLFGKGRG